MVNTYFTKRSPRSAVQPLSSSAVLLKTAPPRHTDRMTETPSNVKRSLTLTLTLAEVEALARAAHAGQTDKAGRPYAEHLQAVAEGVRARGGDDEQIAAAWLHDAVEDDALPERWLDEAALSRRTKDIVLAVTKRTGEAPRRTPGASSGPRARSWSRKRTWHTMRTRPASPSWTLRPASV